MRTGAIALLCFAALASDSFAQEPEDDFIVDCNWDGVRAIKTKLQAGEYRIILEHDTGGGSLESIMVRSGTTPLWMGSVECMKGVKECAPPLSFSVTRPSQVVITAGKKFEVGNVRLKMFDLRD